MPAGVLDRRGFAAAVLAATVATPMRAAAAGMVRLRSGASLIPDPNRAYVPPADLRMILDIYRRMTASVVVDGKGPYQFVVDTGANQTAISAELAQQLDLPPGDPRPMNGVAGVQVTPTALARIRVGARPADDAVLQVLPGRAIGADGMLGLDQLDGGRLTLDFQHQTLAIGGSGSSPFEDEITMKARRRDGQLTLVDAAVAGVRVIALLDSGAQDTIGNMVLRQLALSRYPRTIWSQFPIVSVTGQTIAAEMADLPGFRIGGLRLPNWPVAFADLHTFRMWKLVDHPAMLIGVDILSRFSTVCLDFARDEVRFRLPAA
jgi:predicted aspartyl protease